MNVDADAPARSNESAVCRILSLDGGGAKGFYTLGVLKEIEAMLGRPLHERFDLIFGTSTGAIIAALLALGRPVDEIHDLYKRYVPAIMSHWRAASRTTALATLAREVFGEATFSEVKTGIGIVAAKWMSEKPMIFKANVEQLHGGKATFEPGFGVSIADAVQASCSAFPFFQRKTVLTGSGDRIELIDGGYCANNPTLYAIADATAALKRERRDLRVVSVGVGVYPPKKRWIVEVLKLVPFNSISLLQKAMEINTQSMDQLRVVLFKDVPTIRVNDTFEQPDMATDLMEHDLNKLNLLRQRGRDSFRIREESLKQFLC